MFSLLLAALHYNENGNKAQRKIQEGENAGKKMWKLSYPKSRVSGVIKAVKTESTYSKLIQSNLY